MTFEAFMAFVCFRPEAIEGVEWTFDHPNEVDALRYLGDRGRGGEVARNPLSGSWVFRVAALQDWYRDAGSVLVSPPV